MGCFRECTAGFAKYILIFFNLLILLAACLLIGFSAKYKVNNGGIDVMSISTFTIVVGVIVALIAFFGCCGAVTENNCMITTYAVICVILFILQLVLGILAFVAIKNGNNELQNTINDQLDHYYKNYTINKESADFVDTIQRNLECCGRENNDDPYVKNGTDVLLISSCCPSSVQQCTKTDAYKDHCYSKMNDFVTASVKAIGVVAIIFCAIELLAAFFACYVKSTRD